MAFVKALHRKIVSLRKKHRVPSMRGPYGVIEGIESPMNVVETFIHEVAHWVTAGGLVEKLPSRLETKVSQMFDRTSVSAGNSLEIDTAIVTYITGRYLDLWDDPTCFARSCGKNLRRLGIYEDTKLVKHVMDEFVARISKEENHYRDRAFEIAKWLKPSCRKGSPVLNLPQQQGEETQ